MIELKPYIITAIIAVLLAGVGFGVYATLIKKGRKRLNKEVEGLIFIVAPLIVVLICGFGIIEAQRTNQEIKQKELHYKELAETNSDKFNLTIEYGDKKILWHPEDTTPKKLEEIEYEAKELGEHKVTIDVIDKDDYETTLVYNIKVEDTQMPIITGVNDISLEHDEDFDIKKLNITAEDKVDGPLKVEYEGHDKIDKPGEYTVTVKAKDFNDNETKETFKVVKKEEPKPEPKPEPEKVEVESSGGSSNGSAEEGSSNSSNSSNSGGNSSAPSKPSAPQKPAPKPVPQKQDYQTIKFSSGREVYYYNKGMEHGVQQIDGSPWTATTWDLPGFALTHNNNDGVPTYLAGHYYDAFIPVTTMQVGDTFTIRDHTGDITTFKATDRYHIDVTPNNEGTVNGSDASMEKLYAFTGEGVIFQTCVAGNPNLMIIIEARPV